MNKNWTNLPHLPFLNVYHGRYPGLNSKQSGPQFYLSLAWDSPWVSVISRYFVFLLSSMQRQSPNICLPTESNFCQKLHYASQVISSALEFAVTSKYESIWQYPFLIELVCVIFQFSAFTCLHWDLTTMSSFSALDKIGRTSSFQPLHRYLLTLVSRILRLGDFRRCASWVTCACFPC